MLCALSAVCMISIAVITGYSEDAAQNFRFISCDDGKESLHVVCGSHYWGGCAKKLCDTFHVKNRNWTMYLCSVLLASYVIMTANRTVL